MTIADIQPAAGALARAFPAPAADPVNAALFQASRDCVKLLGVGGELMAMNVNGLCLMEIDDFEPLRGQPWSSLWPAQYRATLDAAVASARAGSVARFSADCPTAKGVMKAWDVLVSPVFDAAGGVSHLVSVSQDVTEQRRAEAQRALLTRELAHRIANTFAVVDGVIALSVRETPSAKPFADGLRRRLRNLGRATSYISPAAPEEGSPHGGSSAPGPSGEPTLKGLLSVLLEPYGAVAGAGQRIWVQGDDAPVGRVATTAVALLAHELATNALKYGALLALDGRIDVTLARDPATLVLTWRESGAGVPAEPAARPGGGFGETLLDNTVSRQLGGRLRREWAPGGLLLTIDLPLASLER